MRSRQPIVCYSTVSTPEKKHQGVGLPHLVKHSSNGFSGEDGRASKLCLFTSSPTKLATAVAL